MDYEFRKLGKIAREARRFAEREMKNFDLGSSEADCLAQVRKHPGCSQSEISQQLAVDKAAITRMVTSLEKKGYLIRRSDPQDQRRNQLFPTEKALSFKQDSQAKETEFYQWLVQELSEPELSAFSAVLERLYLRSKQERRCQYVHVRELTDEPRR